LGAYRKVIQKKKVMQTSWSN